MNKRTDLDKLEFHLKEAQNHLRIAISELGKSAGGIDAWTGSWAEYQRLVRTFLSLDYIFDKLSTAKRRQDRMKKYEKQ